MVKANDRRQYFGSILDKVVEVAFLGTPHQGSSLSNWSSLLATVASSVTLGTSTNTPLVKALESNSKALWRISTSFVDRGKDLPLIFSFFETEKMGYMNCVVGNGDSWILNSANCQAGR
jgi:hypothetical protein